jgi:hypothetical protein
MTEHEFSVRFTLAMHKALAIIQSQAPYRSGELFRSVKLVKTGGQYDIEITASHTVYTEEEWISPQWRGRANPNEGWIQEGQLIVAQLIAAEFGSSVEEST